MPFYFCALFCCRSCGDSVRLLHRNIEPLTKWCNNYRNALYISWLKYLLAPCIIQFIFLYLSLSLSLCPRVFYPPSPYTPHPPPIPWAIRFVLIALFVAVVVTLKAACESARAFLSLRRHFHLLCFWYSTFEVACFGWVLFYGFLPLKWPSLCGIQLW